MEECKPQGALLPAGTKVRFDGGLHEGRVEYGIVVHRWLNEDLGGYDCYVAFFGDRLPTDEPT